MCTYCNGYCFRHELGVSPAREIDKPVLGMAKHGIYTCNDDDDARGGRSHRMIFAVWSFGGSLLPVSFLPACRLEVYLM